MTEGGHQGLDDLIARLRERAADPKRRTDAPQGVSFSGPGGTVSTEFGDLETMLGAAGYGGGFGGIGSLFADLGRVVAANQAGRPIDADIVAKVDAMSAATAPEHTADLPPSVPGPALEAAEARLGFALPPALRRVYGEVANGGFGPGEGLLPIERAVRVYVEKTTEPWGSRMVWPPELLPIQDVDPGLVAIDVRTGRIVDWDPEELTERSGDRAWKASFTEIASSLEAWLEAWVSSRPQHEVLQEQLDASTIQQARESRAMIAAMTPEERAAMGLPEVGWEELVWGGIGLEKDAGERQP
jgi:SMI1 / KNR4 family (SUKH-1)